LRAFQCSCGNRVFFDNSRCLACERELGFLPDRLTLASFTADASGVCETPFGVYRKCENYLEHGVCNWLVPEAETSRLCQACRLNHVIPDLSDPENRKLWGAVEQAKRRLVYGLNRLGLPLVTKDEDPKRGLSFDIKAETGNERVLTGHADGLITLNLSEADTVTRERIRVAMKERYRTLLGHFRHEIGHYYFPWLVEDTGKSDEFRAVFGDERSDYSQALRAHYETNELVADEAFVSTYAQAHPWEDWAETFAHYLHMSDTLETARAVGLAPQAPTGEANGELDAMLAEWAELTVALNMLNRSMGLPDAYPFAITDKVREKLALVHRLVRAASQTTWALAS
jgi:hypothetical protein